MIDDAAFLHHEHRGKNEEILKLRRKKVEEDETHFQTIKFSKKRWSSWRRTNYSVINKWINRNIGRNFDDIYSELSKKANGDLLKNAFKYQIDFTHNYKKGPGLTLIVPDNGYCERIYLDENKTLCKVNKKSKKAYENFHTSETNYDWFMITSNRVAIRSNKNIWFEILLSNKMKKVVYTSKIWNPKSETYEISSTVQEVPAHKQIYPCSKKFWVYNKVFKKDYYGRGFMSRWYPIELTQMSTKRKIQLGILN